MIIGRLNLYDICILCHPSQVTDILHLSYCFMIQNVETWALYSWSCIRIRHITNIDKCITLAWHILYTPKPFWTLRIQRLTCRSHVGFQNILESRIRYHIATHT